MKSINRIALIGTLVRSAVLTSNGGVDVLSGTLAMDTEVNARTMKSDIPFSIVGRAAKPISERLSAGTVLSVQGVAKQSKWSSGDVKHTRTVVQALRTEILAGEFATINDKAGGVRLQGGKNTVTLGGNLTAVPVMRETARGLVAEFSVALNETYADKDGVKQERVTFLDVTAWRDLAELAGSFEKGTPVIVEGAVVSESWKDKNGQARRSLKFEATSLQQVVPPSANFAPLVASAEVAPDEVEASFPVEDTDLPF